MIKISKSKLPDTPSALIRVALADLQKCIDDPMYKIDMRTWHKPVDNGKHCSVCLAGSVLAKTFKVPPRESVPTPRPFARRFSSDCKKLLALNSFREGAFFEGLILMGVHCPYNDAVFYEAFHETCQLRMDEYEYDKTNPKKFFSAMNTIADALERCGY